LEQKLDKIIDEYNQFINDNKKQNNLEEIKLSEFNKEQLIEELKNLCNKFVNSNLLQKDGINSNTILKIFSSDLMSNELDLMSNEENFDSNIKHESTTTQRNDISDQSSINFIKKPVINERSSSMKIKKMNNKELKSLVNDKNELIEDM